MEKFLTEKELSHIGIKGMHWGRRKASVTKPSSPTRRPKNITNNKEK